MSLMRSRGWRATGFLLLAPVLTPYRNYEYGPIREMTAAYPLNSEAKRARAERELGPRFDIGRFHAVLLEQGEMPLSVLQLQVDEYLRLENGRASGVPAAG